jgi:uncharacterized membrane protein
MDHLPLNQRVSVPVLSEIGLEVGRRSQKEVRDMLGTRAMAALAYLLLPVTGVIAYFNSSSARVRFHGLQAIALGALWPLAIYAGSALSSSAGMAAWVAGALVWLAVMISAAFGFDVRLPGLGGYLWRAAQTGPKD